MRMQNRLIQVAIAIGLLLLAVPGFAATPAKVAVVIAVTGEVNAVQPDQSVRELKRARRVYANEIVRTGANSSAKLKFIDGALMTLQADTEYRVDEYRYDATVKENNSSVATLLKGGLRTITGAIADANPEGYKLETGIATIGIVDISGGKRILHPARLPA